MVETPSSQDDIPILDLGPYMAGEPGALERTAAELRRVCETIGFLIIVNHGLPAALTEAAFVQSRRFHAQPVEAKSRLSADAVTCSYIGMRAHTTRASALAPTRKPNESECLFIRRRHGHAEMAQDWPADLPGFREDMLAYYDAAEALVRRMLPLYARALELPDDYFGPLCDKPLSSLRLNHYPPCDYEADQYGIAPHTDSTFLTLLAQGDAAGLQILSRGGGWIDAPVAPDSFVVNTGDLLERWSNGRFRSTPHRASNRERSAARYSIPYTFHPNADTVIQCLPSCLKPGETPEHQAVTAGDYLAWYRSQNYDHLRDKIPAPAG